MKVFLQSHWKLVLVINLLLGIVLWISFFTDYSLRGSILDILYPPFVAILAFVSLGNLPNEKKKIGKIGYLPSLVGGCSYLLMGAIFIFPPFTLAFLFGASEIADEVRIQTIESPNKINVAEVYFRPVGAYTGGSGKIYVRTVNNFLPFIERDIYTGKTYIADEETRDYVNWIDNNTLYIPETDTQVTIEEIKSELPTIAIIPLMVVGLIQNQIEESQLTAPLRGIPVYPAKKEHESISYLDIDETSRRIYFLPQSQIKKVYDWHLSTLSKPPWKVIDTKIVPSSDPAYQGLNIYFYCIAAQKHDNNKTTTYYFEIAELHRPLESDYELVNPDIWDIRVISATPKPDSTYCWKK